MALVLSMKENEVFYIKDVPHIIRDVGRDHFYVDNLLTNDRFYVDDTKQVEVYPEVRVSAGPFLKFKSVKLVIEGPRSIPIMQEKRRNADKEGSNY